jgi:hypothetical protein
VDGLSHRPRAQQRTFLGAGAIDVVGRQTPGSRPKRELRCPRLLRLDRTRLADDVHRMTHRPRAMEPLRCRAPAGQ